MEKFMGHLRTVTLHKLLVLEGCWKVGLYRQGILHDLSKYSPTEFLVGARYFQGNRSPNNAEREDIGYSTSWLHHKGRNRHHFEFWVDYNLRGKEGESPLIPVKMPGRYVVEMLMDRIAAAFGTPGERAAVEELFPQCEKISIDYAVMEPASREGKVFTHPADFGWSDLGNWASLHDKLQKDANGNGAVGKVYLYECSNCVVHAEEASKVVLQGLDGYIVSAKGDRLLVCKRSEEQRIKEFSQN
jgi:hypothetical protein